MWSGSAAAERLVAARRALGGRWEQTAQLWRDPVARGFERDHLHPLLDGSRQAERELQQLVRVIAEARRQVR
ncbi:MAG TPA: hypothetical protein VMU89_22290 [Thermomicrobiaceae bacterium]|nr:hypothetical protein [Thermomicrobiaceae bacterium]